MVRFAISKAPNEALALTNCVIIHPEDHKSNEDCIILNDTYVFSVLRDKAVERGHLGTSGLHRTWARVSFNDQVSVHPYSPKTTLEKISVQVKFLRKSISNDAPFNTDEMAISFHRNFSGRVFTVSQIFAFEFQGMNLQAQITEVLPTAEKCPIGAFGRLGPQTQIVFSRAPDSLIKLKGSLSSSDSSNPVFKSDVSLSTLGIGGLDEEFGEILRRAFASRILPGQVTAQDGMMHVKGLMLYGPPGTGKTLLARQIGSMLNATPPKIVSGPEILNKYVGQSEENIRNLFKEAEAEYKSKGDDSQLHVIIFDEIDAICRQRGSKNDGTGVGDSIVNQLLSKMDGVESLNNILVIGMTNRLSLIDDALLRPGRFEVQIEVSLPDLTGRREIFEIHTRAMRENKHLAADVDLDELAALTPNYTGAEIRGVIASAYSFACMTKIKVGDSITIDRSKSNEALLITKGYFMKALEEVKPAYGKDNTNLKLYLPNGFLYFSPYITSIVNDLGSLMRDFLLSPTTYITSCLLYGPHGTGKSALAAKMALDSDFPFVRLITSRICHGNSEAVICSALAKAFDDAYRSPTSLIFIDNVESIVGYSPIGVRFSSVIMQTLRDLITTPPPQDKKVFIIATTAEHGFLDTSSFSSAFDDMFLIPKLSSLQDFVEILRLVNLFEGRADHFERATQILARGMELSHPSFDIPLKKYFDAINKAKVAPDEEEKLSSFFRRLSSFGFNHIF